MTPTRTARALLREDWGTVDALWLRVRLFLSGLALLETQGSFWTPVAARFVDEAWAEYIAFAAPEAEA